MREAAHFDLILVLSRLRRFDDLIAEADRYLDRLRPGVETELNGVALHRTRLLIVALAAALVADASAAKWEKLTAAASPRAEYMDGDSFHVRHGNKESIFRLYFVDAPEMDERVPGPHGRPGRVLEDLEGGRAQARAPREELHRRALGPGFTVYTQWQDAGGQSSQPRYFAVVRIGKKDLAELLVSAGLARVYGASVDLPYGGSGDSFFSRLRGLESRARSKRRGAWSDVAALPEEEDEKAPLPPPAWVEDRSTNTWNNVPTVAFLRAEAYVNLERFEEAEPELRALLTRYPDHVQKPRIEFYLALSMAMQERFAEGDQSFRAVDARPSQRSAVRRGRSTGCRSRSTTDGDFPRASRCSNDFAAKYPLSVYTPEAEYRAALCRYATEDYKGCGLDLGGWLQKHPGHYFRWEAQVIRGDALAAMGSSRRRRRTTGRSTAEAGPFYYLALTQAREDVQGARDGEGFRRDGRRVRRVHQGAAGFRQHRGRGVPGRLGAPAGRARGRGAEAVLGHDRTVRQRPRVGGLRADAPRSLRAVSRARGGHVRAGFPKRYDQAMQEGRRTLASRLRAGEGLAGGDAGGQAARGAGDGADGSARTRSGPSRWRFWARPACRRGARRMPSRGSSGS